MKRIIVFRTGTLGTWREKYSGIAAYAKSAEWRLHPVDARSTRPDIPHILDFWKPDGIIIDTSGAPQMFSNDDFGHLPVVVMNSGKIKGMARPTISSDHKEIARLATSELLELNPASLAFMEWFIPSLKWSSVKRDLMEEIARMHGIPFSTITPVPRDADNMAKYEEHIVRCLDRLPKPCGIFAATDILGAAAISAATRLGAEIPNDIAIIAVDDDPEICENCTPTLSSVRPDFYQLGFSAGRLLQDTINSAKTPADVTIPPITVVRRASTQISRRCDKKVHAALEVIRLKACEGLSVSDVAAEFGVSRRMAEIRFKAATGRTIGGEILERRLATACEYLSQGQNSISAIANFCGWHSDIAFRKVFKKRFGTSPLKWRHSESLSKIPLARGHGKEYYSS